MSVPASGTLEVSDGHQVAWRRAGASDVPPMLLLHGGPGSGLSASLMARVAVAGWQAIGMDQRGCGQSRPHAGESLSALQANTTVHLIADIERLRRHLGVTAWAVFGA